MDSFDAQLYLNKMLTTEQTAELLGLHLGQVPILLETLEDVLGVADAATGLMRQG